MKIIIFLMLFLRLSYAAASEEDLSSGAKEKFLNLMHETAKKYHYFNKEPYIKNVALFVLYDCIEGIVDAYHERNPDNDAVVPRLMWIDIVTKNVPSAFDFINLGRMNALFMYGMGAADVIPSPFYIEGKEKDIICDNLQNGDGINALQKIIMMDEDKSEACFETTYPTLIKIIRDTSIIHTFVKNLTNVFFVDNDTEEEMCPGLKDALFKEEHLIDNLETLLGEIKKIKFLGRSLAFIRNPAVEEIPMIDFQARQKRILGLR